MNLSCKRPRLTEKWNARRIKSTLAFSSYPQAHSPAEGPPSALQHACPYRPHISSARERVMTLLMGLRLLETRDPPGWAQPRPSPLLSARLPDGGPAGGPQHYALPRLPCPCGCSTGAEGSRLLPGSASAQGLPQSSCCPAPGTSARPPAVPAPSSNPVTSSPANLLLISRLWHTCLFLS